MLGLRLLRMTLSVFSTMFGSLGVFSLYLSFLDPRLGAYALVFLGTATAIDWSAPHS